MNMMTIVVLTFTGITAGVLFCVALSVVPAFLSLPADRYVETHKAIGRNFDRVMPPMVVLSALLDLTLAVNTVDAAARWLYGVGAVLLAGVSVVSQFGNVPINRRVKSLPAGAVPEGWRDPRRRWQVWHLVRTCFGVVALVVNAIAVVLAAG